MRTGGTVVAVLLLVHLGSVSPTSAAAPTRSLGVDPVRLNDTRHFPKLSTRSPAAGRPVSVATCVTAGPGPRVLRDAVWLNDRRHFADLRVPRCTVPNASKGVR